MYGNFKLLGVGYGVNGKFLGGFIIIYKGDRIPGLHQNTVPSHRISNGKHTAGTYHPYIFHAVDLTLIQYSAANGELCLDMAGDEGKK